MGTLNLGFDSERGLTLENEEVAREVAAQLAIAIQQGRQRLTEAESRYSQLFERVPVGLFRTMPDGRYLDANAALVRKLGFADRDELMSCKAGDLYVDQQDRGRLLEKFERDRVVEGYQYRARRDDGKIVWLENNARAIRGTDGVVECYEGSSKNVTAQKLAVGALEERVRLSEFTAEVVSALAGPGTAADRLGRCAQSMVRQVGGAFAGIWTFDERTNVLELRASASMGAFVRRIERLRSAGWRRRQPRRRATEAAPHEFRAGRSSACRSRLGTARRAGRIRRLSADRRRTADGRPGDLRAEA